VDEYAEIEGPYGFRIEVPQGYPGLLGASIPWWGAEYHRARASESRRLAPFIAIVRDRGEGRITVDRDGQPLVRYTNGPLERALLERGMVESVRLHAAAGARRIFTLHTPPLERDATDADELIADIGRRGVAANSVPVFSAHQMSSCRIGRDRATSVADPDGQVWGVRGLYVTDASAFPSASGVNPMLTVMALARRTAQRIARSS
jgi:choline dehydrogenase-like flavoprotein